MAKRQYTKMNGSRSYKKWANWEEGDSLSGKLLSITLDNFKNNQYFIEIEEVDMSDPSDDKGNALEPGQTISLNACGSLDYGMESVEVGDFIQVEYKGMSPMEHKTLGTTDAHSVEVGISKPGDSAEDIKAVQDTKDELF